MMKIYVGHSSDISFREELYEPLKDSSIAEEHTLVFPNEDSDELFDSKSFLRNECDLFVAEVSRPSTGLGIELGWADQLGVPIICTCHEGSKPSSSIKALTDDIIHYRNSKDLVEKIKQFSEQNAPKIGEGLQYVVYDLGDEVKKVPKSKDEMLEYLKKWHDSEEQAQEGVEKGVRRRKKMEQKLESRSFPVLPDFRFEEGVVFQDKVKVTEDALQEVDSLEGKKRIIDDYVELVKSCWRFGFHDMSYNFTLNTGFDGERNLLQLDLGDLIFSKQRIKDEIQDKKWLTDSWSYTDYLEDEIKPYYRKRMKEEITVENLDELWRKNI